MQPWKYFLTSYRECNLRIVQMSIVRLAQTIVDGGVKMTLADLDRVRSNNCAPCKGGDFQWVQFPPGDESLQPVAVGAAEEVTNSSKPLMERIALGDSASMQAET